VNQSYLVIGLLGGMDKSPREVACSCPQGLLAQLNIDQRQNSR